jgi:hypothetical protein
MTIPTKKENVTQGTISLSRMSRYPTITEITKETKRAVSSSTREWPANNPKRIHGRNEIKNTIGFIFKQICHDSINIF